MPTFRDAYIREHSRDPNVAAALALLLGPIGAAYGSPLAASFLLLLTIGFGAMGLVFTWPAAVLMGTLGAMMTRERATEAADLLVAVRAAGRVS